MPEHIVTLVGSNDWSGLYIDGALVTEGHSISAGEALERVAHLGPFRVESVTADSAWLEEEGNLPDALDGVVREV